MMRWVVALLWSWGMLGLSAAEIKPLPAAHAHNDYEHPNPLFDALDRGFCNIEADVWLVDGRLLVAHSLKDVSHARTLTSLYLDPLRARVRRHDRWVYPGGPSVVLLVDIKSEAQPTYAALHRVLEDYADIVTTFGAARGATRAVTVIVSGNRSPELMLAQDVRYAAMDGRGPDLDTNPAATFVPWISENWKKVFTWDWAGPMPDAERVKLQEWVRRAHAQGRKVRFWNTPDRDDAWKILFEAGVDVIGTDDLAALQKFLLPRMTP